LESIIPSYFLSFLLGAHVIKRRDDLMTYSRRRAGATKKPATGPSVPI
jgi:hypothetical protein